MGDESGDYGTGEYLCYQILSRLRDRGINVSRTKFVKLPCIADRFLEQELNHEPVVPRYWFRYGETLDTPSIVGDWYKSGESSFWPGREMTISKELTPDDFELNGEQELLDESAKWAVKTHGRKNFKQLRAVQYTSYAPKEFIRAYGELRDLLEVFGEGDESTQSILAQFDEPFQSKGEVLKDKLDSMIISYPKEEYQQMYEIYLRWDDTMRLIIKSGRPVEDLESFLDLFVENLSEQILFYKYNVNISDSRIKQWGEIHAGGKEDFLDEIHKRREKILVEGELSGELDKVSSSYSEAVRNDLLN